ncbi:NAD(P)H-dependent flavin oxidoreductase YrpB (nitropropane dioxygenase family) [Desulfitispora alkaliphila]|uniref:NAD(P)H-dependent flavin oxidoreductase n=1 Tax=Desulfitispora alkaliphila TaxID=622674 RepID=UPI003D24A441
MQLPELKIGKLTAKLPIIQGGMAVRISTAPLAAAVANNGGVGIIGATGMDLDELRREIKKARELTDGIIGVNVLFAAREFADLVKTAMDEGIDLVVSGAGFSRDMFQWGKETNTEIVSIVSSYKFAKLAERLGAAAVVVEGKEAGGHLGTDRPMKDILPEVVQEVKIPVIAAGGIMDGKDIVEALDLGASGVQMGTRFAASVESSAAQEFKDLYIKSQQGDVVLVNSPVGLPGRGLRSDLYNRVEDQGGVTPEVCEKCLKKCSKSFCLLKALDKAQQGDLKEGLFFSGERVAEVNQILTVDEIFEQIKSEIEKIS